MKKIYFLLLILISAAVAGQAQTTKRPLPVLHGDYGADISRKFYIGTYRGTRFELADSAFISEKGTLDIPLKDEWRGLIIVACGDYEPSWKEAFANANAETSLQFVFEGQSIEYQTSWRNQSYPSYLKYGKGCEATVAMKALKSRLNEIQERMYYLEKLMEKTPAQSRFYHSLEEEFIQSTGAFNAFCDSVSGNFDKNSFMSLYTGMFRQVVPPAGLALGERPAWTAAHLFDYCRLQDPQTANIPLFQDKIRHYLYLNMPVGIASTDEIERSRKAALDRLQVQCHFPLPLLQSQEEKMREQLLTSVNMEELYVSPGYHDTVNGWLGLYEPEAGRYRGMFGKDMIVVLDKIRSAEVFTGFAKDLLTICIQLGWDDESKVIAEFLSRNAVRLKDPAGIIQRAINGTQIIAGTPAPDIVGATLAVALDNAVAIDNRATARVAPTVAPTILLLFYESGCSHCDQIIAELIRDYEKYRSRNIRIITVAADMDKMVYEFHSKKYPWADKLCDFKGMTGENFKNYGVNGTPTIFVIDSKGIIQGQYAKLEETDLIQ